jgi:hypothetical protein
MPNSVAPTRRILLAGFLAAMTGLAALPAMAQDINGMYNAEGRNPDGSAYVAQAVVAEVDGAVQINWTSGSRNYAGTGSREGQVVTVDWGQPDPVVYVVMQSGELHGTWANGTALERLVKQ